MHLLAEAVHLRLYRDIPGMLIVVHIVPRAKRVSRVMKIY